MSRLKEAFCNQNLVLTAEIAPPKGPGTKRLIKNAELLRPHVTAVNITDCQRALVKMSSMAASRILLENGVEPVYQLTCRDRNSIALQSDLMGAASLGISNVLCLTGDPVKVGDSVHSRSVFEMESVQLLELAGKLQRGTDGCGNKMNSKTHFHMGAVVNPTFQGGHSQWTRMEKKISAGAQFFQTQANFNLDEFKLFLEKTRTLETKVLAGILILHSYDIAKYIHENIPGIQMPDTVMKRFEKSSNSQSGVEFAVETMLGLENACDGFHLMTIRQEELIPEVITLYSARSKKWKTNREPSAYASIR